MKPEAPDEAANAGIPAGFIQLHCKSKKEAHCTSHELMALNSRLQSASHDCLVLTFQASAANLSDLILACQSNESNFYLQQLSNKIPIYALTAIFRKISAICFALHKSGKSLEQEFLLQILERLRSSLLQRMELMHKLIDNFALFDMLSSFGAVLATSNGEFVRPAFTAAGPVAIKQV